MNAKTRQYLFGAIFLAMGIYQLTVKDYWELGLYALAGASFIVNALTLEPPLIRHKKALAVVSWVLIGATGILFLYLLQFKHL